MQAKKSYELIEHTADIGIKIKAKDLKGLFQKAGLALFKISSERTSKKDKQKRKISIIQKADNLDELFINWLNELLSLSAVKGIIFERFKFNKLNESHLDVVAFGSDVEDYKVNTEIKAATYHRLVLRKTGSGWQAEIFFDV
jgi:SHS2 domain-containing protein